jgi:catechol 2,3-dioxygenase-like lactoylglutathione lyase family enzyme
MLKLIRRREGSLRVRACRLDRFHSMMKFPFILGTVGHFGLAVRDPKKSAKWFARSFGLKKQFEFEDGIAVGNDHITIALSRGKPSPKTIGHMSFYLPDMATLRTALAHLKRIGADLEDPGDEIGPEAPDSPHMGLWLHDPDGYRWELSVQDGGD